jgi:flagellar biosynthetic protein FlhB
MADSSKSEQATPRHRQKARERGQVTRSRDLTGALSLCGVAGAMYLMCENALPQWAYFFRRTLDLANTESIEPGGAILFWTSMQALRWIIPILVTALAVSVIAGVAQGGFVFAPEALEFKFERLNPADRLSQLVSLGALSPILKSMLPFAAIAWVGFASIRAHWISIVLSTSMDVGGFVRMLGSILLELCWKSGLILLIWSGVDYLLLWFKQEGDLKMSRQEIKDEMRQTEGNPESKARVRRILRQSRRRQMLKAAETATVVITNPTHYAVALRYEPNMKAPLVVAKGLDNLAAKIKDIAWRLDIPTIENRPLAQALYKTVEVGDPIPSALYHAVAEILVAIYKAQAEVRNREAQWRASQVHRNIVRSQ